MGEIFRAPEEDWAAVERESAGYSCMLCICELRDRVAVLEARERDFSTVRNETGQYLRAGTPVYADPRNPLFSYSVGKARPLEECGKDHAVPTSAPAEPNDPAAPGFFPVEYADADGKGIRILMEPADETGRACWVVRNSRHVNPCREFPTPEAAYAAHRDAAHAQQQATVKESLTAEPAPADPEDREWITDRCPAPSETNFYGWVEVPASCRSSQPITEDGRRYTEYYLIDKGDPWLPASADYYNSRRALFDSGYKKGLEAGRAERRQEAATEESSAAHSEPANPDAPAPTEPAPPAPAGGLTDPTPTAPDWRELCRELRDAYFSCEDHPGNDPRSIELIARADAALATTREAAPVPPQGAEISDEELMEVFNQGFNGFLVHAWSDTKGGAYTAGLRAVWSRAQAARPAADQQEGRDAAGEVQP